MAEVDKMGRSDALELAKKMRNKVRNLEIDKKEMGLRIGTTVAGAIGAYVVGSFMGGLEVEYEANQAAIDAGTMEDPRKIMGVDIDLALGIGLSLAGGAGIGGKKLSSFVKSGGDGVLAGYTYSIGFKHGKEAAQAA